MVKTLFELIHSLDNQYLNCLEQFEESFPGPFNQDSTSRSDSKEGATQSSYKSLLKPFDFANEMKFTPFLEDIFDI